jgi:3-methylfumaryl-CoA hydratase
MFAGSRLQWYRPLVLGFEARREAEILKIELKSGRSGALAFVTVAYRYYQSETSQAMGQYATTSSRSADLHLCLEEEQDIVYREPGPPLRPPAVAGDITFPTGAWTRTVVPDTRLLFRFSALTFNAHRIHYDRPYATEEEGYPGLVVHGPLTAMLLLQLVREHTTQAISKFRFRSQAPLLEPAPIQLVATTAAGEVELQAIGPGAQTAMIATATLV